MQPSLFRLFLLVSLFFEGVFTSLIPLTAQTVPAPLPASFSAPGLRLYAAAEGADGLVYLVGEMDAGAQDRNGVILAFDPQTNRLAQWGPDRGSAKNDGFRTLAALPNGKLAVGGYRERDTGKPEPWLLLIDLLDGQALEFPIRDNDPAPSGITLLAANDRNQALAIGFKALGRDTVYWAAALDGNLTASAELSKEPLQSAGETWKDVRALFSSASGDFVLAGNYAARNSKYRMWLLPLAPAGLRIAPPLELGEARYDNLAAACLSLQGNFLVFGETESKGSGIGPNAWLQEFTPSGNMVREFVFGDIFWDQALFVQPAARNEVLIGFRSDLQRGGPSADSVLLVGSVITPLAMPGAFNFPLGRITAVPTFDNRFALLALDQPAGRSAATLLSPPQSGTKGDPAVTFTVLDAGNLLPLKPGGEVSIRVLAENRSQEAVSDILLKPELVSAQPAGILLPPAVVPRISSIGPGQKTVLELRLKADLKWQPAPVELRIRPFVQKQAQTPISVRLPQPAVLARGETALFFMDDPKRTVPKSDNAAKIQLQQQVPTGYGADRVQTKLKVNGTPVVNNKTGRAPVITSREVGNRIISILEVEIPLEQDTSYLSAELWLDGVLLASTSESIRVIRNYRTSLHVLSIGPPYKSFKPLKFTSKDARDVGDLFRRQPGMAEGGLFDTVFVQVLDDSLKTTRIAIEGAFEDLARKAKPNYTAADRIDPEDVVVVFISSHGEVFGGDFHILGSDADGYRSTALNLQYCMGTYLYSIPCKMIFLLDACHAGSAKGDDGARMSALLDFLRESPADRLILASSSEKQSSYEDDGWQNGLFTEALLRVFAAKAGASGEEMLSPNDLFRAMEIEMQALNQNKYTQTPHLVPGGGTLLNAPIFKPR